MTTGGSLASQIISFLSCLLRKFGRVLLYGHRNLVLKKYDKNYKAVEDSYLGMIGHGNAKLLRDKILYRGNIQK